MCAPFSPEILQAGAVKGLMANKRVFSPLPARPRLQKYSVLHECLTRGDLHLCKLVGILVPPPVDPADPAVVGRRVAGVVVAVEVGGVAAVEPPARVLAVGGAPWEGTVVSGGELVALVVVQRVTCWEGRRA